MIIVYVDHNVIVNYGAGRLPELELLVENEDVIVVVSMMSIDEIFRGKINKSEDKIESLKRLGVKYVYSDDDAYVNIGDLDYERLFEKWQIMNDEIALFDESYFHFITSLFQNDVSDAYCHVEKSVEKQIGWINKNYNDYPSIRENMDLILQDIDGYKKDCKSLVLLKEVLPFNSVEINNISEKSVFWSCVHRLRLSNNKTQRLIGDFIEEEVWNMSSVGDQFDFIFMWLNIFRYYSDDLRVMKKVRSNFSDSFHGRYAVECNAFAILTLDKRFAKRLRATLCALKLSTEVFADVNKLCCRIAGLKQL